ncbi:DNA-3-methyladenine glycosylase I [Devosia sp. FKR38]|uniref:DNA-3-methyladenine glycosylase I n=1 Tax=Devosia sp. FKR38 TaxID=2562312 RepID=UPI0010C0740D|nr:DNA-3-methyladenine glycosylase I [Devosia sp. FKR38]
MSNPSTDAQVPGDGLPRCPWAGDDPLYRHYHDQEWGRPVVSDTRLFEKICLEGFQSGLSWITILRKRENFRAAFHGFDIPRVAAMTEADVERLLGDAGIIRHRGKIVATIHNAGKALELQREFGSLAAYFWRFETRPEHRPDDLSWPALRLLAQTDASRALSKDLRKRGFKFVGPTTCYAFMQAMGLVNDHTDDCFCRAVVETERDQFKRPLPASA